MLRLCLGPVKLLVTGSSSRDLFEIHVCDPFRKMLILKLVWAQLNLHYKLSDLPGLFSKCKYCIVMLPMMLCFQPPNLGNILVYHLESRWRNSHVVLVYHGSLLSSPPNLGVAIAIYAFTTVHLIYICFAWGGCKYP